MPNQFLSGTDRLVLPFIGQYSPNGTAADNNVQLKDGKDPLITVVNIGTGPLTVLQPQRPRRPRQQGTLEKLQIPPPGPPLFVLRNPNGGPRGSSWATVFWNGTLFRCFAVIQCSTDLEFCPEPPEDYPANHWIWDAEFERWLKVEQSNG
jgi:hypothetical protein